MPKSKIIKSIVDDEVSLDQLLIRLQVIAHDLKNMELETWAENELVGYSSESDVPEYRRATSVSFTYSGINNQVHTVKNIPLDLGFIGKDLLDRISDVRFTQSITALESFLDGSDSSVYIDRSAIRSEVYKNSGGRIQCFSIGQVIPKSFFQNALAEIKNRLLKSFLLLEEEFGCLDELGIDVSGQLPAKIERVNYEINSDVLRVRVDPPIHEEEPMVSKIAWNVIVPIATALIGGLLVIVVQSLFGFPTI